MSAPWWMHRVDRAGSELLLVKKSPGTYLVRHSDSAACVLCVVLPDGRILHVKVFRVADDAIQIGEGASVVTYPGPLANLPKHLSSNVFPAIGHSLGPMIEPQTGELYGDMAALQRAPPQPVYGELGSNADGTNGTNSLNGSLMGHSGSGTLTGSNAGTLKQPQPQQQQQQSLPPGVTAAKADFFGDSLRVKSKARPGLAGLQIGNAAAAADPVTELDSFALAKTAPIAQFPAYLTEKLKVSLKPCRKPDKGAKYAVLKQLSKSECCVYLTPDTVHIYPNGASPGIDFSLEPRHELQVDDGSQAKKPYLAIINAAINYTLTLMPSKSGGPADLNEWRSAVEVAKTYPNTRVPLPPHFNRAPAFQSAMVDRIFGTVNPKAGPVSRQLWHDYLVNPQRQAVVEHLLQLANRCEAKSEFAQAADTILALLQAVDRQPALRCVLVGIDFKPQLVDAVVATFPLQRPNQQAAVVADEHAKLQRFIQLTDNIVATASAADDCWLNDMAYLLDYGNEFTAQAEAKYNHMRQNGSVKPPIFTEDSLHWYMALADVRLFRYYMADQWVSRVTGGVMRYLTLLQAANTRDQDVAALCVRLTADDFVPGTTTLRPSGSKVASPSGSKAGSRRNSGSKSSVASGVSSTSTSGAAAAVRKLLPEPRLSLADMAVILSKPDEQRQAFHMLVQRHAIHNESFLSLMCKCLEQDRLPTLNHICRNFIKPDLVPDAAVVILGLLAKDGATPTTAGSPAKEDIKEDATNMLLENACHFLGISEEFCRPLDFVEFTDEQRDNLKSKLDRFAARRFRMLMEANKSWFSGDKDAKDAHKRALEAGGTGINLERPAYETVAILVGMLRLCGWRHLAHLSPICLWGQRLNVADFRLYLVPTVRTAAAAMMQALQPNMLEPVAKAITEGQLMNRPSFFSHQLLAAVDSSHAPGYHLLEEKIYLLLLSVADKLDTYNTFDLIDMAQRSNIMTILPDVKLIMRAICKAILDKEDKEFIQVNNNVEPVTIVSIALCAVAGADARLMLPDARGKQMLQQTMQHYLEHSEPSAWLSQFSKLDVIAFFLKYLMRESYDKAWVAFQEANKEAWILNLLGAARASFNTALVDPRSLSATTPEEQERLICSIEKRASTAPSKDMAFVYTFSAAFMRHMREVSGIPMLPHNTQIICVLLFATFYRLKKNELTFNGSGEISRRFNSLIAEVGTGEGKSVIIAMMALYFAVQGEQVHVLENNVSLRDRDYNSFKDFYAKFTDSRGNKVTTSKELGKDAHITYCLQNDLESLHLDEAPKGKNPLAGKILIVDEVDDLILDRPPSQRFVMPDDQYSVHAAAAFAARRAGRGKPSGCPDKVWTEVNDGAKAAGGWRLGREYAMDNDDQHFRILDE